jgi:glycosyltransferase involved in cell wall biosynthesis
MPEVSVIIPAYDRAQSVGDAITSVLAQEGVALEVIVVDDASTDDTAAVVAAMTDPRLRLIRHPRNMGVSAARNTGIDAARGDLIAFQDSDDLWLPGNLAAQVAALHAAPKAVASYCGMIVENPEVVGGKGSFYMPPKDQRVRSGDLHLALLGGNFISTQTLVVRRAAIGQVGAFDPGLPALVDWDFVLRLSALGPIMLVDKPLVQQRYSENSLTRSLEKRLHGYLGILEKHRADFAAHPALLARHHHRIAGVCRRLGRRPQARHHILAALREQPLAPRRWAQALWLMLHR